MTKINLEHDVTGKKLEDDRSRAVRNPKAERIRLEKGGKVVYRGREFVGYYDDIFISPMHMLFIHSRYEELLRAGDWDNALRIEAENNYPDTWLNSVADRLASEDVRDRLTLLRTSYKMKDLKDKEEK